MLQWKVVCVLAQTVKFIDKGTLMKILTITSQFFTLTILYVIVKVPSMEIMKKGQKKDGLSLNRNRCLEL